MNKRKPEAPKNTKPNNKSPQKSRRTPKSTSQETFFTTSPTKSELPERYADALLQIKQRIQQTRLQTVLVANATMLQLYWEIGTLILDRQDKQGWGAKVIDRLSKDLRDAYPEMKGLSSRNLKYMRSFAAAWDEHQIVQEPLAQITWSHHLALLEKVKDPKLRTWYARQTVEHGWSRHILVVQIENQLHQRQGKAVPNFPTSLPPAESDMAKQVFKDPYLFDFLGTAPLRREQEIEQALVEHIQQFLLELGAGFAFIGRQIQLEVGGQEFALDLLFYHVKLRCYVVIELKAVPFSPAFVGQLNLYLSAVDDLLRHPDDKPTIGLLLCKEKNRMVVEYALRGLHKPIGVAEWETRLVEELPENLEGSLPTIEQLEAELTDIDLDEVSTKD